VGESRFDPALISLERKQAALSGDHSSRIGLRGDRAILYPLLAEAPGVAEVLEGVTEQDRAEMGWPPSFGRNTALLRQADNQLRWVHGGARSYSGWLVMNAQFQSDQRQFCSAWREDICQTSDDGVVSGSPEFQSTCAAFLDKWYLERWTGPFLPVPIRLSTANLMGVGQHRAYSPLGASLFIPMICPLPDRQFLREMLEEAMGRLSPPPHLKEWIDLVHSAHPGKNSLARFARLFVLQHYWWVLHSRHASILEGNKERLRSAFAAFLFPGVPSGEIPKKAETVRNDLQDISDAMGGPDWYLRPRP